LNLPQVVTRWLDTAFPHRQGPQIGKVLSFGSGAGENSYSARVRVLKPGSLEETERVLEDVPVSPIWAGPGGTGIYAPLPADTLVVIGYVEMNPSYPYIQGVWGEFYNAADFQPDECLITSGGQTIKVKGKEIEINGGAHGGLIRIEELKTNLQKNTEILSLILSVVRSPVPIAEPGSGSPSALQGALRAALLGRSVADFSRIENTRVRHG